MDTPVESPYPRTLHAIMVEICNKQYLAVCVWPDREPEKPCAKLPDPNASWLDVKAGDKIHLKGEGKRLYWVERVVKQVVLYRVFPVDYNGRIVTAARDWLEGRTDGAVMPWP